MRCTTIMTNGRRCTAVAREGSSWCACHREVEMRRDARAFLRQRLAMEDENALAEAARIEGLDSEIALLRMLVRRGVGTGDFDSIRLAILSLARALKTKRAIERQTSSGPGAGFEALLDRLALEWEEEES